MTSQYSKLDEVEQLTPRPSLELAPEEFRSSFIPHSFQKTFTWCFSTSGPERGLTTSLQLFGTAVLIVVSFVLGFASSHWLGSVNENAYLDTAWDDVRNAIQFETKEFNPRFTDPPSPYMGEPTPEVDRLWYDLSELRNYGVDRSTLEKMNRSRGAVEFGGADKGRYYVHLEVFHQLHCLNYIRMYTYQDHYGKFDYDMIAEDARERQAHKDHCVENLRQRLMCNPDLNIYGNYWVSRHSKPWTNLYTEHRCVNWDAFYDWAETNIVHTPAPVTRPEGVEVYE